MNQKQNQVYFANGLKYQFFIRHGESKDLTMSNQQQLNAIIGILRWLNQYENIKQLSHIGKNPILRYNYIKDQYNSLTSIKTVRLDCEGKFPFCRYYVQQDQVKGKTNLAQIYVHSDLDHLMQLNSNQNQKKQSQKWRGRVQNALLQFRKYVSTKIKNQKDLSVAIRIELQNQSDKSL